MPSSSTQSLPCPSTQGAILSTLCYFEIFRHPLTAEEVWACSNCPDISLAALLPQLDALVESGQVFVYQSFYQMQAEPDWVARRLDFNRRADTFLPKARRMARLIGAFPFIRAVLVSGSLSKHCMPPDGDIDYFLITEPGRLWLARTLLVLFKKIFLFNSHKYFCVNYFIDTEHLEIEEKNLFTATETSTLLPLYGAEWCERFWAANDWRRQYLPNFPKRPCQAVPPHRKPFLKKIAEWMLSGGLGARLDILAMRFTVGYWRRKFRHFDERTFDGALKSRRYVSKHHPLYFQQKVLAAYAKRMQARHTH